MQPAEIRNNIITQQSAFKVPKQQKSLGTAAQELFGRQCSGPRVSKKYRDEFEEEEINKR
jgi:hypothetical protein